MSKQKTIYICSNCNAETPRWQGKCPDCNEWNTLEAKEVTVSPKSSSLNRHSKASEPSKIVTSKKESITRFSSGISELDQVLGGGIVPGCLILLGGDPGIGKSTLALQSAVLVSKTKKVLYISGEESVEQVSMRCLRLYPNAEVLLLAETSLEAIIATLEVQKPDLAIIDSVQTISSEEVNGVIGGVSQVSFVTNSLMRIAKKYHIAMFIIGHVTKEGLLAGPKTMEHMVDTVLYLEGERFMSLRILRSSKNRFGSVGEIGVFEMAESGLVEVKNPSLRFLDQRQENLPGSCIAPVVEGNKVLLVEVQALTTKTSFGYPRRTTSGFDLNRLQLICAIIQKTLNIDVSSQDVYINIAGGFAVSERAVDVPVALAIISSLKNKPLPNNLVAFGEIGLLGEIRTVTQVETRLKELEKLGFNNVVVGGYKNQDSSNKFKKLKMSFIGSIKELVSLLK